MGVWKKKRIAKLKRQPLKQEAGDQLTWSTQIGMDQSRSGREVTGFTHFYK